MSNINEITQKEMLFYNNYWVGKITPQKLEGPLVIPGVKSIKDARILICSCGSGEDPVRAANAGAKVFAFDISPIAVENARLMAEANKSSIEIKVLDFHSLEYPDNYFDYIYGSAILHHVDCEVVGKEIYRCLKPGGIAFFWENSDRNSILRFFRNILFGLPGQMQKQKSLIFRRQGTADEYPLTEGEVKILSEVFSGNLRRIYRQFWFFSCLAYVLGDTPIIKKITGTLDKFIVRLFPAVLQYSFEQGIWLQKNYR